VYVGRSHATARIDGAGSRTNGTGGGPTVSAERPREESSDDGHLRDVPTGSGCTEIWEHLSERRDVASGDD
jgi:hypothetical protein